LRNLNQEKIAEAFQARQSNAPAPGVEGGPLKVALGAVEGIQATSIELVASGTGIVGVHTGTAQEAFSKALAQFRTSAEVQAEPVKSAIISASAEAWSHSTLGGALNSLWNSVHAVKEGGTAVLLAECREGLGGGALQAYVEGRLADDQVAGAQYSDGLEHLLYLQELKEKKELALVSTLPRYYANKLGFVTFSSARDALESLLAKHGRSHKALVVADADITLLKTAG
jgi:nickel-dependent lactate racemase